ncbi:endodeoxyribonuclease [Podochytrium sp. JEL0797]|nr:endodeoxyribonuclease [Podochytrium sp. JEL0797]
MTSSDVSSLHSLRITSHSEATSDSNEESLDELLLAANAAESATQLPLGQTHHVLRRLQRHLQNQATPSETVRVGVLEAEKGDVLRVACRPRNDLCAEIKRVLLAVERITRSLKSPALELLAKDDSVWSYNPESKLTILACDPAKAWRTVKSESPRFDQIVKVFEITLELLRENKTATKRDIYYRNVSLFKRQATVDDIVESIACSFSVPRHNLNIVITPKFPPTNPTPTNQIQ